MRFWVTKPYETFSADQFSIRDEENLLWSMIIESSSRRYAKYLYKALSEHIETYHIAFGNSTEFIFHPIPPFQETNNGKFVTSIIQAAAFFMMIRKLALTEEHAKYAWYSLNARFYLKEAELLYSHSKVNPLLRKINLYKNHIAALKADHLKLIEKNRLHEEKLEKIRLDRQRGGQNKGAKTKPTSDYFKWFLTSEHRPKNGWQTRTVSAEKFYDYVEEHNKNHQNKIATVAVNTIKTWFSNKELGEALTYLYKNDSAQPVPHPLELE